MVVLLSGQPCPEYLVACCSVTLEEVDEQVGRGLVASRQRLDQEFHVLVEAANNVAVDSDDIRIQVQQLGPDLVGGSVCVQVAFMNDDLEQCNPTTCCDVAIFNSILA